MVQVDHSFLCVCVCVRTITFEINDPRVHMRKCKREEPMRGNTDYLGLLQRIGSVSRVHCCLRGTYRQVVCMYRLSAECKTWLHNKLWHHLLDDDNKMWSVYWDD